MFDSVRIPGITNILLGRVAVRTDGKLVMGALIPGIPGTLEAGALYEIRDDGENIILKKIGMSSLTDIQNGHPGLSHQGLGV